MYVGTGREEIDQIVARRAGRGRRERRHPPRECAAGVIAHSAYGSCPLVEQPKPVGNNYLCGPSHKYDPIYPTAVPNKLPRAYVTPAAAPPRTSCRSPLNHQVLAVTRATTAPQANSPASASSTAGHSEAAPSR